MGRKANQIKEEAKFLFLGFFSDKILRKAGERNYLNILIAIVLSMIFLYFGIILGFSVPFRSLYNRATEFRNFAYAAFAQENGIKLHTADNYAKSNLIINTFDNEEDSQKYSKNGYELVIDTRPSDTTYDDFEAYCLSNDGKNTELTYEEYLTLSDVAKLNFDFKIRYTGKALKFTEELTDKYKAYLDTVTDESIVAAYNELKVQTLSETEFNRKLYALYVKAYYPDISGYETSSDVPLVRTYYYQNYLNTERNSGKYIFIFDYSCMVSFETDSGISVSYGGFYTKLGNMTLDGTNPYTDSFIYGTYEATKELNFYIVASGLMNMMLFMLLVWVLCFLLFFAICKFDGLNAFTNFGVCAKVVANFVLWGGIAAALSSFISGFFVARDNLFNIALAIFFLVLAVRTVVFLICEHVRKTKEEKSRTEEEKIYEGE